MRTTRSQENSLKDRYGSKKKKKKKKKSGIGGTNTSFQLNIKTGWRAVGELMGFSLVVRKVSMLSHYF